MVAPVRGGADPQRHAPLRTALGTQATVARRRMAAPPVCPPVYDQEGGTLVGYEGGVNDNMVVAYEANQGKLIDRRDKSKNRRNVPGIITWDDLK